MAQIQNKDSKAKVLGLAHLLLQVTDLEAAEAFYCSVLGLEVKNRSTFGGDRPLTVTIEGLGITTCLSSLASPHERNMEHVAFWVTGIDKLLQKLKEAGFSPTEPKSNEYGKSMSVRDPDGNRVELIEEA